MSTGDQYDGAFAACSLVVSGEYATDGLTFLEFQDLHVRSPQHHLQDHQLGQTSFGRFMG